MTVAIIPALAEAGVALERIFVGRPLLVHSIEQARLSAPISRIIVASDDGALRRLAGRAGAEIVAADGATDGDAACARAAQAVAAADGEGEVCVILDPSRPLRTPEMIEAALAHLASRRADSLISVHETADTLWVEETNGLGRLQEDEPGRRGRRAALAENRAIVITTAAQLRDWAAPLGGRIVLHRVPAIAALRMQGEDAWCAGEALHRRLWAGRTTARLAQIRLLVFDFDGVMTDNRVVVFEDGREGVLCSRGDGMGMDRLREAGLPVAVISKEGNPVVTARCRKLKIPCVQGVGDKLPVLQGIVAEQGITLADVAYMGNDINDLECMQAVGLAVAPADAEPPILRIAGLVTVAKGGFGAVRELADLIVAAREAAAGAAQLFA